VTSKDAWMPDVTERLDAEGVQILVQPEFFVGDTIRPTGPWAPDNIKGAGYSDVLRWPSIDALVLPELTGNVFDLSADNQQAIAVKSGGPKTPHGGLVGQAPAPGFAAVQPWVIRSGNRLTLGRAGLKLLPSSTTACRDDRTVGPCRGGQPEGVLFHDVTVGRRPYRPRAVGGAARPLARSRGTQRNVALAASGRLVFAAFEDHGSLVRARSTDAGARWQISGSPLTGPRQWWPSISVRGNEVWLAAQVDDHVVWTHSTDGGKTFEPQHAVDSPAETWRPSIAATTAGHAYLAWIDTRDRFTLDDLPQAGLYGARLPSGAPTRVDSTAPPDDQAQTLDNAWAPSVAARGRRILISWTDFRTYDWRIYSRQSADAGATFAAERTVTDAPKTVEALDASPRSIAGTSTVAYTAWRRLRYGIRVGARSLAANAFWPAVPANGAPYVAWQDMARGTGRIWLARLSSPARRVALTRGANAWRPAIAVAGSRAIVAWEDSRDGPSQIYVRRMPLPFRTSRP
jgi:hypothetical protein